MVGMKGKPDTERVQASAPNFRPEPPSSAGATGRTKPTILRAIQLGKISAQKDEHGGWQIDPAELHRVYRFLELRDNITKPVSEDVLGLLSPGQRSFILAVCALDDELKEIAENNQQSYTDDQPGGPVNQRAEYYAAADYARDNELSAAELKELIEQKLAGKAKATARETTGRAKEAPRPDWVEAHKKGVTVPAFIERAFAEEIANDPCTGAC